MDDFIIDSLCRTERDNASDHRKALPQVINSILESMDDKQCFAHIGDEPIHFSTSIKKMIDKFREILFPGYFSGEKIDGANLVYNMGQAVSQLYDILSEQIVHVLRHDCLRYGQACLECENTGNQIALKTIKSIPKLRITLSKDIKSALKGDPAAKSHDEIIFSYPGLYAITVYRIAHILSNLNVPQLPRLMTEHAHSQTGIDIHPGAKIGEQFVIDHGTGIVVGETSVIGNNVRIYQNVTIGALSLPPDAGVKLRGAKRHPTIEDDVIIYSGATILGGKTNIGTKSVIGGNVWLTSSVPKETKVFIESPRLIYKYQEDSEQTNQEELNHEYQV
ncbi:MAG: serine acetyltransferase [Deltaproteobacteria bacterium]|nr:serine acetyltransferase [Deltaproteobacteria bacterium]